MVSLSRARLKPGVTNCPGLPGTEGISQDGGLSVLRPGQSRVKQDELSPFLYPTETRKFLLGKSDQPRKQDLQAEREERNALSARAWIARSPSCKETSGDRVLPHTQTLHAAHPRTGSAGRGSGPPVMPARGGRAVCPQRALAGEAAPRRLSCETPPGMPRNTGGRLHGGNCHRVSTRTAEGLRWVPGQYSSPRPTGGNKQNAHPQKAG